MRVFLFALVMCLSACGNPLSGHSIKGRWTAESTRMQSLIVPLGPDIVVADDTITMPGLGLTLPVTALKASGAEATAEFPGGIGVTFHLESADRMYVDIPLVSKIYYKRSVEAVSNPQSKAGSGS